MEEGARFGMGRRAPRLCTKFLMAPGRCRGCHCSSCCVNASTLTGWIAVRLADDEWAGHERLHSLDEATESKVRSGSPGSGSAERSPSRSPPPMSPSMSASRFSPGLSSVSRSMSYSSLPSTRDPFGFERIASSARLSVPFSDPPVFGKDTKAHRISGSGPRFEVRSMPNPNCDDVAHLLLGRTWKHDMSTRSRRDSPSMASTPRDPCTRPTRTLARHRRCQRITSSCERRRSSSWESAPRLNSSTTRKRVRYNDTLRCTCGSVSPLTRLERTDCPVWSSAVNATRGETWLHAIGLATAKG